MKKKFTGSVFIYSGITVLGMTVIVASLYVVKQAHEAMDLAIKQVDAMTITTSAARQILYYSGGNKDSLLTEQLQNLVSSDVNSSMKVVLATKDKERLARFEQVERAIGEGNEVNTNDAIEWLGVLQIHASVAQFDSSYKKEKLNAIGWVLCNPRWLISVLAMLLAVGMIGVGIGKKGRVCR